MRHSKWVPVGRSPNPPTGSGLAPPDPLTPTSLTSSARLRGDKTPAALVSSPGTPWLCHWLERRGSACRAPWLPGAHRTRRSAALPLAPRGRQSAFVVGARSGARNYLTHTDFGHVRRNTHAQQRRPRLRGVGRLLASSRACSYWTGTVRRTSVMRSAPMLSRNFGAIAVRSPSDRLPAQVKN